MNAPLSQEAFGLTAASYQRSSDEAMARLLRSFANPLRLRILRELDDAELSPKEAADRLDEHLGTVSYHITVLAAAGALEPVRQVPVRGAVQHFYRATPEARRLLKVLPE